MNSILFVDDEIQVLKAIRRVFTDTPYNIQYSESAASALEIMGKSPADIIVTDIKMPGMNGIELLKIIKEKYPKTVRLILSGYSDENEVLFTLQSNLAKAYMFKPWNNDELLRVITDNLQSDKIQLPNEITTYINNLDRLPTTGARYRLVRQAIEENENIAVISAEIEKDQALTAKILQMVNSAYYGIKTGSVKKALSFIGTKELLNLVKSIELMNCISITGPGCDLAELMWNHAYYTNKIQQIIQEKFQPRKRKHEDVTAGLLHKIGIVLMIKFYEQDYVSLLRSILKAGDCSLLSTEQEIYGYTHPMISAYLLRWWNAPEPIIEAAANYSTPDAVKDSELANIVHIAQHYACMYTNTAPFIPFQSAAFENLQLDRTIFENLYRTYF